MKWLNKILEGDSIKIMEEVLPPQIADVIFADPPYNLQLEGELFRPNETRVNGVEDAWDKFASLEDYDAFTTDWLKACKRILKDEGTIWVIGSYHNIYRIGKIMGDLGFWILNDICWIKSNPMPNFRGVRFTNAHETLIWAKKSKEQTKYTFNYQSMKTYNDDKQMRSDWYIPICTGNERIKIEGAKAHSTQKPEALLRRVILASTQVGDTILDPFFGTGTTGAVAKKLGRNFIGIEKEPSYLEVAQKRIAQISESTLPQEVFSSTEKRCLPKVPFSALLEANFLSAGDFLYSKNLEQKAQICADGSLKANDFRGSIHQMGAKLQDKKTCNGWDYWFYYEQNNLRSINELRDKYRRKFYSEQL